MRKIKILDTTLRDGEQSPGCTMHLKEKVEFAKKLELLGIDIIEAGFPVTSNGDMLAVKNIAEEIKNCEVCALARAVNKDIRTAYECIRDAVAPRLHIFIPTSPIHLECKLKITEEEALERIKNTAVYAKSLLDNIQYSFEDATRSDKNFLIKAINTAIKYGATTVNIADTVGFATPDEIKELVMYIVENVDLTNVNLGLHCHNDLGMATANSLMGIKYGVNQIEGTINGIGERSGNAAIEEIVMALYTKSHYYDATTRIYTKAIYSTSKMLSNIIGSQVPPNKPIVGSNVFLHESGIHQHGLLNNKATYEIISPESIGVPRQNMVLGKHSGKHAFEEYLKDLRYNFSQEETDKYFNDFKELCDKKKFVTRLDIEALVTGKSRGSNSNKYKLVNFLIATKKDGAFATVTLSKDGEILAYQAEGNGAVDSSFTAVNKILNVEFKLIDYSLHAVTSGEDALGEAVVKLSNDTTTMTGRGLSTDIIEASILAYIDAAGKLMEV